MSRLRFYIIVLLLGSWFSILSAQAIQPDTISARIVEAMVGSCGELSDSTSDKICFDIYFSVNKDGWTLHSYNIWVDFGTNDQILAYLNDQSCFHREGGDTDLSKLGKYRIIAGQNALELKAKKEYNIHNICFNIQNVEGIEGLQINAGGDVYGLLSSVNLVDQTKPINSCNLVVPVGKPLLLSKKE